MADTVNKTSPWTNALGTLGGIASGLSSISGIGSAIQGIAGLFGDSAETQARKQMEMQKELLDYSNQLQVDQWNRENAYNAPIAQRKRLEAAGLNPLFNGIDGNTAGGLSSVSSPAAPDLSAIKNAETNQQRADQENALLTAQVSKTLAEADEARKRADWYETNQGVNNANTQANTKNTEQDTKNKEKEEKILDQRIEEGDLILARDRKTNQILLAPRKFVDENGNTYESTYMDEQANTELSTMNANLSLINQTIQEKKWNNDYLQKMSKTWEQEAIHRINMMKLTEAEKKAMIGQVTAMIGQICATTETIKFNLAFDKEWKSKFAWKQYELAGINNVLARKGIVGANNSNLAGIWAVDSARYGATAAHGYAQYWKNKAAQIEMDNLDQSINSANNAMGIVTGVITGRETILNGAVHRAEAESRMSESEYRKENLKSSTDYYQYKMSQGRYNGPVDVAYGSNGNWLF